MYTCREHNLSVGTERWSRSSSSSSTTTTTMDELTNLIEGAKHGGPKFLIQFTCDADADICSQKNDEDRRSTKIISKKAYEEGICLIRCPCEKLHLIADNLGWFGDEKSNVETIMAEKGQEITKLVADEKIQVT